MIIKTSLVSLLMAWVVLFGMTVPVPAFADLFDELEEETNPDGEGGQTSQELQAEYEAFGQQQQAEYEAYKEQLLNEFEGYKRIVREETSKYQEALSPQWDAPVLSTKKVWVDYSADTLSRKSVDFEQQTITLEVPESIDPADSRENVRAALTELVAKNKAEAFKGDVVAQAVEKRSKEEINSQFLKTAEVQPVPILISYLTGSQESSQREVEAIVDYMLENIKIDEVEQQAGRKIRKVLVPLAAPQAVAEDAERRNPVGRTVSSDVTGKLPSKAVALYPHVSRYAERDKLEQALVYAIIETESAFNPMARSPVPAYGLMQIVPESAGMDATKQLFKQEKILSSSYLYNSEQNIEIGTTYLNILYYRYLAKIENPQSRLYCVIAAYNTGAGNVAKAFTGNRRISAALPEINSSTPQEVYVKLRKHLPYEETRRYIVKVTDRIKKYEDLGL